MSDKPKNIFAGVKLTDQTTLAEPGPDQRLFSHRTPEAPPSNGTAPTPAVDAAPSSDQRTEAFQATEATIPRKVDTYKPKNIGTKESRKHGSQGAESRAATAPRPAEPASLSRFDFDVRPGHQANFVFTDEELDALDDVKRDARRVHGLTTTKQDIVRYAVIDLLEDFDANGPESRLIRWLKQRPHRR